MAFGATTPPYELKCSDVLACLEGLTQEQCMHKWFNIDRLRFNIKERKYRVKLQKSGSVC